jgi:hypothetical protein
MSDGMMDASGVDMKRWIFALLLCVANPLVSAEQFFERAGVTKTINAVSVLPKNKKAAVGDVITKDLALKTGGDSRAELEFPDLTITRVGATRSSAFLQAREKSFSMVVSCSFTRSRVTAAAQSSGAQSLRR